MKVQSDDSTLEPGKLPKNARILFAFLLLIWITHFTGLFQNVDLIFSHF